MKASVAVTPRNALRTPPLLDGRHALFIAFDGSLAWAMSAPKDIVVRPEMPGLLAGLEQQLGGAMAVVSWRRIESLDHYLKPVRLHAAGLHGAQLRVDGHIVSADIPAIRETPDGGAIQALGFGKERAIRSLMRDKTFRKKLPVFVGSDDADEDALREVQSLGGFGVRIGSGRSIARCRLDDSAAVFDWLCQSLRSMIAAPLPPYRLPLPYLPLRPPANDSVTASGSPQQRSA